MCIPDVFCLWNSMMDWEESCSSPVNTMVTHAASASSPDLTVRHCLCVCVCVSLSLSLSISGAQVVCLVGCYQSFCCSFLSWLSVQGSWCTGISIARFWWKRKPKLWAWNWRRETDKSCQQELVFLVVQVLLPREIVLLLEERRSSADHERVSRISSLWQSPSFSR